MFEIRNDDMLKLAYEILAVCTKRQHHIDLKRAIRNYHRKQELKRENSKLVFGDSDSYTELIPVPYGAEIYAEEWFDNEVHMEYIPSQYDCTGQRFTVSHRFVTFRGRMHCIHHVAIDV